MTIGELGAGCRVDAWLARRFPAWSRTEIQGWIRIGGIESEDRDLKPSSRLRPGEKLRIRIPGLAPTSAPPPLPPILYEDDKLLVVDKPAGLLCHPAGDHWTWAVIGLLREARPDHHVDLVHRLDRDTSGVLLLTKDMDSNAFLKHALKHGQVDKHYQAIARGRLPWERQDVRVPVGNREDSEIRLRQGVTTDGKEAWTAVELLQHIPAAADATPPSHPDGHSLVAITLHTGRTHQIRVHMEHLGFGLLGDRIYGQPDDVFLRTLQFGLGDEMVRAAVGFPRQALHCASMTFPHPTNGPLTLTAPLAADLQQIVDGVAPRWAEPSPQG